MISWPATTNDGGDPVTAYRIKFKKSDGTLSTSTSCDGTNSVIFTARSCTVAMSVFTSTPYTLAINDLIVAVVEA